MAHMPAPMLVQMLVQIFDYMRALQVISDKNPAQYDFKREFLDSHKQV